VPSALSPELADLFRSTHRYARACVGACLIAISSVLLAGTPDLTARGSQPGLTHPLEDSGNCTGCHAGGPIEFHYPATSWKGSMMANAGRDPVFWAALDVANADGESLGVPGVGDWCLRCHVPEGWFGGRVSKTTSGGRVDGADGCLLQGDHDDPPGFGNDYSGIGCHFCHRVEPKGPAGEPNFLESGDIWIDDLACATGSGPCRAGPYDYSDGTSPPPHAWKKSEHISSSEMCGSCHNVTSPLNNGVPVRTLISPAGIDTGIAFPIERTYTEWLKSDYGTALFADGLEAVPVQNQPGVNVKRQQTCQDCHMEIARSEDPQEQFLGCFFGPNRNGKLSIHNFSGANTWVPKILKGEFPSLGLDEAFDQAVQWSTELLTERTATIVTRATRSGDGQALAIEVEVTNLSGHKLPTGYSEGRRMWIELEVRDAGGAVIYSNGAWNPATGELQRDAQTRVYEIKQGIWDPQSGQCKITDAQGRAVFHFVRNNCVAKDNRIPPLGFTGGGDIEVAPVAAVYPPERPGSNRLRNVDVVSVTAPIAGAQGALTIRSRLHYQTASKEYIEFLRDQAVERGFPAENTLCADGPGRPFDVGPQAQSRGAYLYSLWSNPSYGRSPPVMVDSAQVVLP
jgi:hypothetical protein